MKKFTFAITSLLLIIVVAFSPVSVAAAYPAEVETTSEGLLLVNMDTDTVVYEKNADVRLEPASITKIILAILLIETLGDKIPTEQITVPDYAIDLLAGTNSSLGGVKKGEILTAEQLLNFLLVPSGNDAAMVIADYLGGGSIEKGVEMMNQRAQELGCTNTHFANPHGLHDPEHYASARDIYIMAKHAMELDYFMDICKKTRYVVPPTNKSEKSRTLVTTNSMMETSSVDYYYRYVQGIKTGSTVEAGYCLVSTAYNSRTNDRYLCVALDAPYRDAEGNKNKNGAMLDTKALYEWAFNSLEMKSLVKAETAVTSVKLEQSWKKDSVLIYPKEDFSTIAPKEVSADSVLIVPQELPESLTAPVEKDTVVGQAKIMYADMELGTVDLVIGETIDESFLLKVLSGIENVMKSKWFKIIFIVLVILVILYIGFTLVYNKKSRKRKKRQMAQKKKNTYTRRF